MKITIELNTALPAGNVIALDAQRKPLQNDCDPAKIVYLACSPGAFIALRDALISWLDPPRYQQSTSDPLREG